MTPLSNVQLLDEILSTRREMAEAMGCASYSDYKALHASLAQVGGGGDCRGRGCVLVGAEMAEAMDCAS